MLLPCHTYITSQVSLQPAGSGQYLTGKRAYQPSCANMLAKHVASNLCVRTIHCCILQKSKYIMLESQAIIWVPTKRRQGQEDDLHEQIHTCWLAHGKMFWREAVQ